MKNILVAIALTLPTIALGQLNSMPGTLLWGVTNSKGDTSYLFAVFHEFGNSFLDQFPETKCHRSARCIVLEALPDKASKIRLAKNWVKDLSKADYTLIDNYMHQLNLGYSLKQARRIPASWLCYALLSELYKRQCGVWTKLDVIEMEGYLANSTITFKKELYGLESNKDTFNVVNTMMNNADNDDTAGIRLLKDIVLNERKYLDSVAQECWEADNYKALKIDYKFSKRSEEDDPAFPLFLDKRNDAWLPRLTSIIDTSTAFVAVGMKHLFYQKGLIVQLRERGYHVFPIEMHKTELRYKRQK
ncbi:MAG: TraB/GumN family protein [Bacteroidota bacterium]